jgi:hypothetical protein
MSGTLLQNLTVIFFSKMKGTHSTVKDDIKPKYKTVVQENKVVKINLYCMLS